MDKDVDNEGKKNVPAVFTGIITLPPQDIPFANFVHNCKLEDVLNVMIKEWKLQVPKIMLAIVSNNDTPLCAWPDVVQQDKFVKGLIKASNATSMWIITNGLNIGIAKVIGDAFEEDFRSRYSQICYGRSGSKNIVERTPLIGVCSDIKLTYYEEFRKPVKHIMLNNTGNKLDEHRFNLNPFHTNFLLIRDLTNGNVGVNRFLLKLEDAFRGFYYGSSGDGISKLLPPSPVPAIAVLVQGNVNSATYIWNHLKSKLPVLIVRGSGGLADILSYAYYEVYRSFQKIKDKEYVDNVLKKSLSDKIKVVFPNLKDNKMAQTLLCKRILDCIDYAEPPQLKYITVFNMLDLDCDAEDIPNHLLETIFKSQKSNVSNLHHQLTRDLLLTIDWNCPELAITKVFYKDPTFKVAHDVFEQTLLKADREEFISMFLDHGFDIQKYMSSKRIITLFEHALKEDFFREVCWERVLGYRKIVKLDDYFIDYDLNWIISSLLGIPISISSQEFNEYCEGIFLLDCPPQIAPDVAKRKSITVLIVWALVSNRGKLAIYLWRHVDHPVMTSLACSLVLDRLQKHITEKTLKDECVELGRQFSSMAVGVFDLCYNDMPSKAYDSLSLKNREWGEHSVIDMAALAHNTDLVAHPCCQKWLTNTFMGNINIRDLTWGFMTFPVYIKVILCAFFIFPMYLWVRFKDDSVPDFVTDENEGNNNPYYVAPDMKKRRSSLIRQDQGKAHLLRYYYPPMWKMIYWMWSAPITKFWVSNIFYVIYLAIFSLAVIWTSCGNMYLDILICIWTSLIAFHSIHRLYALQKAYPNTPMFATSLEVVYIFTFVIFVFAYRIYPLNNPYGGKILMCLGLLCFYYRMIFIYLPISATLGPLLYRVKEMITVDFVNFMKLVSLILIANGIAMQAILYPDYPLTIELVRKLFHKAFIAFFMTPVGELKGTEADCVTWEQKPSKGNICRVSNYVDGKCSSGTAFWPYVIVFQYMLLLKLILLTILYALFNNTGAKFGPLSNVLWKFQRYHLVVKFSVSLRLPPPLNIFSLIGMLYQGLKYICNWVRGLCEKEPKVEEDVKEEEVDGYLPAFESNYWRQLARDYYDKENYKKSEEEYLKKEVEIISKLSEDVHLKEEMINRAKSQIAQLEADISYTHSHLETLKYREKKGDEQKTTIPLHSLSRESPYPRTNIQRFPVPDKYVPWEVMWLHYEPNTHTLQKSDLPIRLQPYADEDILAMKKKEVSKTDIPNYLWNMASNNNAGVYQNRKSWLLDARGQDLIYRLDLDDLPCNPRGRTGLRGKGALPRWGPNQNIFTVITRSSKKKYSSESDHSLFETDQIDFVQTWYISDKDLSLPGGFVWTEGQYEVIQSVFKMDDNVPTWLSSDEMIQFFRQHACEKGSTEVCESDFRIEKLCCGYMDDQLNTDHAWKEVELWHIHYTIESTLKDSFKKNTKWKKIDDDTYVSLPYGQTTLLQDAIHSLKNET